MEYEFRRSTNAAQTACNINNVYGENCTNKRTARYCFARFRSGNFDLKNEPRDRPCGHFGHVDELKAIVEADDTQSRAELAAAFDVRIKTILVHLRQIGKVKKLETWVPHTNFQNGNFIGVLLVFLVQDMATVVQTASALSGTTVEGLMGLFIVGLLLPRIMKKGTISGGLVSFFLVVLTSYGAEADDISPSDIASEFSKINDISDQNKNQTVYVRNTTVSYTRLKYGFCTMMVLIFCCTIGIMIFYWVVRSRIRQIQRNLLAPVIPRLLPEGYPHAAGIHDRRDLLVHGREGRVERRRIRSINLPDVAAPIEQAGSPTQEIHELAVFNTTDQIFIVSMDECAMQPPSPPMDMVLDVEFLV